jgi:phosphocarrier protein
MKSFSYTIKDELGLHARPAGLMVKRIKSMPAQVVIRCGERSADGRKLFAIMGMCVKQGEIVTVEVDGEGEEALCGELLEFFEANY